MRRFPFLTAAAASLIIPLSVANARPPVEADHAAKMEAGLVLFKEGIRPLLEKHCLDCHGGKDTKADIDVSSREALVKGDLLGKSSADSKLYRAVAHLDEPFMPKKADKLPADQIALLAKWIDLGAPYDRPLGSGTPAVKAAMVVTDRDRDYWAFRPLKSPAVPAVRDAGWTKNPIDPFIRSVQERAGLSPAAAIDRRGLIRRVYFDLIGLPPEPAEVDAFVAATDSEAAYSAVVDKLLGSPHHGERWARHWLDLGPVRREPRLRARLRPSLPPTHYRDFVIEALNAGPPVTTRFVQAGRLAGDEFGSATITSQALARRPATSRRASIAHADHRPNQVEKEPLRRARRHA